MLILLASDLDDGGFLQEKLTLFVEMLSTNLTQESQKPQDGLGTAGQWQAGQLPRSSGSASR